ncbi:MAG: hypothetical protein ABUR63_01590 [Verrucomicrobiota bacterium]
MLKSTLAQQLEKQFGAKPASAAQAASDWASAYVSYASSALSAATSLPVTATANQGLLVAAFTAAFQTLSSSGAAAAMAQGVTGFWAAMVWAGPLAVGSTVFPGNAALSPALAAIFADTSQQSDADKARALADAFDAGAKMVMVNDVPLIQPAPPIVGPIS